MKTNLLKNRILFILILLVSALLFVSCSKTIYDVVYPTLKDGRYDSEFPYKNASEQLEDISKSVKMMNYIAYYKAYIFNESQKLKQSDLKSKKFEEQSIDNIYFNETVSGTATIIFYDGIKVGLLTCAHIGDMPDTVITYFDPPEGQEKQIIQQVAIKIREHYYINEIPGLGDFKVILKDKKSDLALLSKRVTEDPFQIIKPFNYPIGVSGDLELGSFVYILGYPMGHKMITKGIVSNTKDDKSNSFLIDALFNRGFSGGIILAIRDGVPNFELVGIAKSVSAKNQFFLSPAPLQGKLEYDTRFPYTGKAYVKKLEDINYGITYTISTDEILKFFESNNSLLKYYGFNFDYLFK